MIALSACEAVSAMRAGTISATAYSEALLARCDEGADLNAFITLESDAVLRAAHAADLRRAAGDVLGPLHGLPIPIKDSINTADLPTTAGTAALRDFRPVSDAPVVARLREAGAIVLGKTNLHELSLGWTSSNRAYGPVRNPWDRTRIPGGSSGGTAAAVAFGMAPLGVAEDTQGSIRVPAALCGIAGFRPTTGRYPNDGCAPITPVFDQIGPQARDVGDLALFDCVMTDDFSKLSVPTPCELRIGVAPEYYFADLDPAVDIIVSVALERLADAGVTIVTADLPGLPALIDAITMPVQLHDVVPSLKKWLVQSGSAIEFDEMLAQVSPDVKTVLEAYALADAPLATSDEAYADAISKKLPKLRALLADWFAKHSVDAMLLPTTMVPATPIGLSEILVVGNKEVSFRTAVGRNISPASTAGLPGVVIAAGSISGLPVGIELDGPPGTDRRLLGIAMALNGVLAS